MCIRDRSKEEVLKELDSSIEGLSTAQAQERLAIYGHNELDAVSYTHLDVYKRQYYDYNFC